MYSYLIKSVRSVETKRRRILPSSADTDKENEETPNPDPNGILKGFRIYVHEFGDHRTCVLRNLIRKHGGIYISDIECGVTHILLDETTSGGRLCRNLAWEGIPINIIVLAVNWLSASIQANRLLPYDRFAVLCPRSPAKPLPESPDTENSQVVKHTEASGEDNFEIRTRLFARPAKGFRRRHYETDTISEKKFWSPVNSCSDYEDYKFNEETTCDDEWLEIKPPPRPPPQEEDNNEGEAENKDEEVQESEEVNEDRVEIDKNNEEVTKDKTMEEEEDDIIILSSDDEIIVVSSDKEECVPGPSTSKHYSTKQTSHQKNPTCIPGPNFSESVAHSSYMESNSPELIVLEDNSEPSLVRKRSPSPDSLSSAQNDRPKSAVGLLSRLRLRVKVDKSSKEKLWKIVDVDTNEKPSEKPQSHKRKKKRKHNSAPSSPDLQNEVMNKEGGAALHEEIKNIATSSRRSHSRKHKKNKHKKSCASSVLQTNTFVPEGMLVDKNLPQERSNSTKEHYPHHKKFRRSRSTPTSPIGNEELDYKDLAASNSGSNGIPSASTVKSRFGREEPDIKGDTRKNYSAPATPNTQSAHSAFCSNIVAEENNFSENIQDKFSDMLSNTDLPNKPNLNETFLEGECDPNNTSSNNVDSSTAIPVSENNSFDVCFSNEPVLNSEAINQEDLFQDNMCSNDLASSTAISNQTSDKVLSEKNDEPGLDSESVIVPDYEYYNHNDTFVRISCSNIQPNLCTVSGKSRKRKRSIENDLKKDKEIDQLSETDVAKSNVSEVNHIISNKKNDNSSVSSNPESLPIDRERNNYAEVLAKIASGGFSETTTAPYWFKLSDLPRVDITVKVPPLVIPPTSSRFSVDQFKLYELALQESTGFSSETAAPQLECAVSQQECSLPRQEYAVPQQECAVSQQECAVSQQECAVPHQECPGSQQECPVSQQECPVSRQEHTISQQECTVLEKESAVPEKDIAPSESKCTSSFPENPTISDLCSPSNIQIDSETREEIIKRVMLKYKIRKLVRGIDKCIQIEPIIEEGEGNYHLPNVSPTDIDFFAPIPPVSLVPPSDASYFPMDEDTSKVKKDPLTNKKSTNNKDTSIVKPSFVPKSVIQFAKSSTFYDLNENIAEKDNKEIDMSINKHALINEMYFSMVKQIKVVKNVEDLGQESIVSSIEKSTTETFNGHPTDTTATIVVDDLLDELECKWKMDMELNDPQDMELSNNFNDLPINEICLIQEDLTENSIDDRKNEVKYVSDLSNASESARIDKNDKMPDFPLDRTAFQIVEDLLNELESDVNDSKNLEAKSHGMPTIGISGAGRALKGKISFGLDVELKTECANPSSFLSEREEIDLTDECKNGKYDMELSDNIATNLLKDLLNRLESEITDQGLENKSNEMPSKEINDVDMALKGEIVSGFDDEEFKTVCVNHSSLCSDKEEMDLTNYSKNDEFIIVAEKIAANLLKDLFDKLEAESDTEIIAAKLLEDLLDKLEAEFDLIKPQVDKLESLKYDIYPVQLFSREDLITMSRIKQLKGWKQTDSVKAEIKNLYDELEKGTPAEVGCQTDDELVVLKRIVETEELERIKKLTWGFWRFPSELDRTVYVPPLNPTKEPVILSLTDLVDENDSNSETPNLNRPDITQRDIFFPFPKAKPISAEQVEPTSAAFLKNLPNQSYYLSPSCPNFNAIAKLQELYDFIKDYEDEYRINAYEKAIFALGRYHKKIESLQEVQNICGIGRKIACKVWEIVKTGYLEEVKLFGNRRYYNAKRLFRKSWGITTCVVKKLFLENLTTVKEALQDDADILDVSQRLALSYYYDLKKTISTDEAKAIFNIVSGFFKSVNENLEIEACSSLRRNERAHSKVAVLVVLEKGVEKNRHLLDDVVAAMHKKGYIIDDLNRHEVNGNQSKYAGIFRVNRNARYRKLDIWVVPYVEKICAAFFMTGPSYFLRAMVHRAEKQEMVLDEHGIRHRVLNKNGATEYVFSPGMNTERDIFEHLNVPYRDPDERRFMPYSTYFHGYHYPY